MPPLGKDWHTAIGTTAAESKAKRLLRLEDEIQAKRAAGRAESAWFTYKMTLVVVFVVGAGAAVAWHFGMFGAPIVKTITEYLPGQTVERQPFVNVPSGPVTVVQARDPTQAAAPAPKQLDAATRARIARLDAGIDLMERDQRDVSGEMAACQRILEQAQSTTASGPVIPYANMTLDQRRAFDLQKFNATADVINARQRIKELAEKYDSLERRIHKADAEAQDLDRKGRQP